MLPKIQSNVREIGYAIIVTILTSHFVSDVIEVKIKLESKINIMLNIIAWVKSAIIHILLKVPLHHMRMHIKIKIKHMKNNIKSYYPLFKISPYIFNNLHKLQKDH